MAKIKTALEIALERTESVKSDKSSIELFELRQKGKKLANEFLAGIASIADAMKSLESLKEEIKKESGERQASFKQGIFDVLISRIALPGGKDDVKLIESAGHGLHTVIGGKRFGEIVKQLVQMLNQYLGEAAQYEEGMKRQYAPKLRQKEEEIERRIGRAIKLDPFQDPEFVNFFNQNMNALKSNYQSVLDEVREEALRLFKPV